jgi:hypothetical protein
MATKKDLTAKLEKLAERIAISFGAQITTKQIKVGGRLTDSVVAEGGVFDLDACRGILMKALDAHADKLVGHFQSTQAAAVKAAYELQEQPQPQN